jgi:hypothetical protein
MVSKFAFQIQFVYRYNEGMETVGYLPVYGGSGGGEESERESGKSAHDDVDSGGGAPTVAAVAGLHKLNSVLHPLLEYASGFKTI